MSKSCSGEKPRARSAWRRDNSFIAADHRRRALLIALAANAAFLGVELVGGVVFGSLALLADGVHMVSDVVALSISYWALVIAQRPPTARHTFGLGRAEVLVAEANGVLLIAGAIAITVEAIHRLSSPPSIDAAGVIIVGGLGIVVNFGSAWVVGRHAHGNLNMRGATLHLAADALGSIAVVVAGIGAALFSAYWLDPVASLVISALVVIAAWQLLRDATRVLLEAVPADLDAEKVTEALCAEDGVEAVHHLHIWTSGSERPALSAHVVLGNAVSLHDAQLRAAELKEMLTARFGIDHTTLEVECHACVDDETHRHEPARPEAHSHRH